MLLGRGGFIANRYVPSDISIAIKWIYQKNWYRKRKFQTEISILDIPISNVSILKLCMYQKSDIAIGPKFKYFRSQICPDRYVHFLLWIYWKWTYRKWWRHKAQSQANWYQNSNMSISDILFFCHTTLFTHSPFNSVSYLEEFFIQI
jgi:hypothetical protein